MGLRHRIDATCLTDCAAAVYVGAGRPEETRADVRRIATHTGLEAQLPC